jgi:hypothetical protein
MGWFALNTWKSLSVRDWIVATASIFAIALVCFGAGLHGRMFGDDFLYLARAVAPDPFWFFTHANPLHPYAYRPIEFGIIWITQDLLPSDPILLHAIQLALHVLLAGGVAKILANLGCGRVGSALAGLYILVSQSAVHAVVSVDTVSQQLETVFGCASLYFLHGSVAGRDRIALGRLGLSVGFFGLTLFGKELGMSLMATFILYLGYRTIRGSIRIREGVVAILPHLLVAAAYMALRKQVGLPSGGFGERPVDFHIGANLLTNPVFALVQVAMPFSSADVFLALKAKAFGSLILPALGATLVLGGPAWGLLLAGRARLGFELAGLFFSSICIAFLMNHISELYVYSALPFLGAYFAIGTVELHRHLDAPKRMVLVVLVAAIVLSNILACRSKTVAMVALGERAAVLTPQVERFLAGAPKQAKIALVNPAPEAGYSVFKQEGFVSISTFPYVYRVLHKREDLDVSIIGFTPAGIGRDSTTIYLTYDHRLQVARYAPVARAN